MAGRPGFLGGLRTADAPEREGESGFGSGFLGQQPAFRLGDPNVPSPENGYGTPGFDPVWGTLGAPVVPTQDDWATRSQDGPEGVSIDVEVLGAGFQVSGQIHTGQFDRLSDWINMQTGFIQIHNAWHAHLGQDNAPDPDQRKGTLWVRLDQVVLVAERQAMQSPRPGAAVVQKQKRMASIVAHGYTVRGNLFLHTYGSMKQFLESPDPHFLPMTDLSLRWLSDAALSGRFPFAMVNREQVVTVLDETSIPANTPTNAAPDEDMSLQRRWGAA